MLKLAADAEHKFLKCKGHGREKKELRGIFKMAHHAFDRHYRSEKRKFQKIQQLEIEEIRISNPKQFWTHLKKLGHQRASKIPMSVIDEDGNVSYD